MNRRSSALAVLLALLAGVAIGVPLGRVTAPSTETSPSSSAQQDLEVTVGPGGCAAADALARAAIAASLSSAQGSAANAGTQLGELIFLQSPYEGFRLAFNGEITPFDVRAGQQFGDITGFVHGYSRSFEAPRTGSSRDGFIVAQVYEFESPAAARLSLVQHVSARCADTAATFSIEGHPDAAGISVRAAVPPVQDEVLFVRGPRRYLIARLMQEASDGHHDAAELLAAAARLAQ